MLIESTQRLLSTEASDPEGRAIVASAHASSIGQQLRGWVCRFLVTSAVMEYIAALPVGAYRDALVVDIRMPNNAWTAYIKSLGPADTPEWSEAKIPDRADTTVPGILVRIESLADLPISPEHDLLDRLVVSAQGADAATRHADSNKCLYTVIADAQSAILFCSYPKEGGWGVLPYRSVDLSDDGERRLPESYSVLAVKKVGIVGFGALGSKIATSLGRSGVRAFVLVDDDIFTPGNLVRHDLDVGSIGAHKAIALSARLKAIGADVTVSARRVALGGQESSGSTASVLNELATCDLLIDATGDPQAFNFVASAARNALRPMIWSEVYAGGIGGFVGRVRPGIEPPPHSARQHYLAWCRAQGVPWHGLDHDYAAQGIADETLIADDSDVGVIAAHATRMAVDLLVHPDNTAFPHPAYVIGLAKEWIFSEPFDTRPIDFLPDGEWTTQPTPERTEEAINFMLSVLKSGEDENPTDALY
jgi:hypothetical protein